MISKERSLGNKGFSLVELIVVIAIMAILVGVVAPQLIKYIGVTKRTRDVNDADTFAKASEYVNIFTEVQHFSSLAVVGGEYVGVWSEGDDAYMDLDNPSNILELTVNEAGFLPVSCYEPSLYWVITYDMQTTVVHKLYVTDDPSDLFKYEVYPDGSDYISNGIR